MTSRRIPPLRLLLAAIAAATIPLALGAAARPGPAGAANDCRLEYQRADNMWAGAGRPDGGLGVEAIVLPTSNPGRTKVFITDWAYEKTKNDGVNFYGSHLRIAENKSATSRIGLFLKDQTGHTYVGLKPGEKKTFRHDLESVTCGV